MRIALIGEGQTEYFCLPKLAGRLGSDVVRRARTVTVSSDFDWPLFFEKRVVPLVFGMLDSNPDKIVVVLDREDRDECPPDLAKVGLAILQKHCGYCLGHCEVSVVISNRKFESLLFADYAAVDRLPILKQPVSHTFPETTDGRGVVQWIKPGLENGCAYDKVQHGCFLAQSMDVASEQVRQRSRSLRKLIKELTPNDVFVF